MMEGAAPAGSAHQPRRRVLLTGAAGRCGVILCEPLSRSYDLTATDVRPVPGCPGALRCDLRDRQAMVDAARGIDCIVHAGALAGGDSFDGLLQANIIGSYHVFEAARLNGVQRVIFFSTNHATGGYENDGLVARPDDPIRPDGLYACSKVYGEALGRLYSDVHGISVICLRIGSVLRSLDWAQAHPGNRHRWITPGDLVRLVECAIDAPQSVRFLVVYGVSNQRDAPWDISNARSILGYDPQDTF